MCSESDEEQIFFIISAVLSMVVGVKFFSIQKALFYFARVATQGL